MLFTILALLVCGSQALFIDTGNPYADGPLLSSIRALTLEDSPLSSTVVYPDTSETMGFVFFVGGFHGLWPGEMYSETLRLAASHGFVVYTVSTTVSELPGYIGSLVDSLAWARNNLSNRIGVNIDWNAVQYVCHSAGCHGVLGMLRRGATPAAKAVVWTDPVSWDIENPLDFPPPPAMIYGTGLAGNCVSEGWTFDTFYAQWSCTRILHVVKDYGHCDYMDDGPYSACTDSNFCDGAPIGMLPAQRQYVQGIIAGMFMWKIQNQPRVESLLTNPQNIPNTEFDEFLVDVNC